MTIDLKRVIQETADATEDFIGNKIVNKITKFWKISTQNTLETVPRETESIVFYDKIPKERFI